MRRYLWVLIIATLFFSCHTEKSNRVMRLAHVLDVNHPVHKGIMHLAEKVDEKSGGKLQIKVYPNGTLGSERESLELLQIGSLDMTKVSAAPLENFAPPIRIFGIPYLFEDVEHVHRVLDSEIGDELLKSPEKAWIRGICYYDAGARSFYMVDEKVTEPSDLKGQKVRVMNSNTSFKMVRAFGGSPTPISFGELYTSLQQGVVDGAENNPPSFYLSKHYEVCSYYSLDEHTFIPDVLLISTHTWNDLSDQEKAWLMEAADESVEFQRVIWNRVEQESLDAVKKAGVEVTRPDKGPFMEKVQDLHKEFSEDPVLARYMKEIKAMR